MWSTDSTKMHYYSKKGNKTKSIILFTPDILFLYQNQAPTVQNDTATQSR